MLLDEARRVGVEFVSDIEILILWPIIGLRSLWGNTLAGSLKILGTRLFRYLD
jgi:hypothetical protein